MTARSDVGVAFADLFWPTFVEFEDHVFREDFSLDLVRNWQSSGADRKATEAAVNMIFTLDMFVPNGEPWSELVEKRAVFVGRTLSEAYREKLKRDFPNRTFVVKFCDGSQSPDEDISVSFWQA